MVKKVDMPKVRKATLNIARFIELELAHQGHTIQDASRWLDKSYSYTYYRIKGAAPIIVDELETIAKHLGYMNLYAFFKAENDYYTNTTAAGYVPATATDFNGELVASQDNNRDAESETPLD